MRSADHQLPAPRVSVVSRSLIATIMMSQGGDLIGVMPRELLDTAPVAAAWRTLA